MQNQKNIENLIKINKYHFDCEVISPLFLGNANQKPEIRTQSINGVLRWIFRILSNQQNEYKIFGTTSNESNKGLVKLKIVNKNIKELNYSNFENDLKRQGYQYLGFSLKMNKRYPIDINSDFELITYFNPLINEDYKKMFFATLWLAFNLFNFGARARRGFGSIKINSVTHNDQKINEIFGINFIPNFSNTNQIIEYYTQNLEKIKQIFKHNQKIPGIPTFFDNFYIYLFNQTKNNYIELLNKIGEYYKSFRRRITKESRIVFGLPIKGVTMNKRRASLLIFKPIKTNNNNYYLLIIKILPTNKNHFIFHPSSNKDISFNEKYYDNLKNFASNNTLKIYEPIY